MSKEEVDLFFVENKDFINEVINNNRSKQVTVNKDNVLTLVYLACLNCKVETKEELTGVIVSTICNQFKWYNSELNRRNKTSHTNHVDSNTYYQEEVFDYEKEISNQNRRF